jgi:crossover junction endodeoxyribonuclease RusA
MSHFRMTPQDYLRRQQLNAPKRAAPATDGKQYTERCRLVLPMPPTVNHSTGPTGNGGRFLTKEHREFRNEVTLRVVAAGSPMFGPTARLALDITLVPADRRRWDLDNRIKALQDALQCCGVYADDEQIDEIRITRTDVMIPGEASAIVVINQRRVA